MAVRANRASSKRPRDADAAAAAVRERILAAFSARARRAGIRSVLMGELASELRMSAMTLYKHFASKEELVETMVDAWALELAAIDSLDWESARSCSAVLEMLLTWADAWTASLSAVSPAFFEDLRRDHPEAWHRFNEQIDDRKRIAVDHLTPFLREDVDASTMLLMLEQMVMRASSPRFTERLGISRREAVRAALSVWGGGALRKRTNLRGV